MLTSFFLLFGFHYNLQGMLMFLLKAKHIIKQIDFYR